MTNHQTRGRAFRALALIGVSLYILVLAVSPAFHHDFACHQRSPVHCQACQAHPPAPQPADFVAPTLRGLPAAEAIEASPASCHAVAAASPSAGRSPPLA